MKLRILSFAMLALALSMAIPAGTRAQGQPLDLPCVTGVTVEPIGQAMPAEAPGQALVVLRITIAPGGGFEPHTHPGTLVVAIESGKFGLTQLDAMPMSIMRAASNGTPAATEQLTAGATAVLNPGDWFVEPKGMLHKMTNAGNTPTVVLVSGVVDPSQPLVQCVSGTPAA
jgi:quercetin dioxygenase-like cupin family protein